MKLILAILFSSFVSHYAFALDTENFTRHAELKFGVSTNFVSQGRFEAFVEINNQSRTAIPEGSGDWQIYIHSARRIVQSLTEQVTFQRIQGDLYRISPTDKFAGIAPGKIVRFGYRGLGDIASYSYFMPRAFMVDGSEQHFVFRNTDTETFESYVLPFEQPQQYLRFNQPVDRYGLSKDDPEFEQHYKMDGQTDRIAIVPTPQQVTKLGGKVHIDSAWTVKQPGGLEFAKGYLVEQLAFRGLKLDADNRQADSNVIELTFDPSIDDAEGYRLVADSNTISIKAKTEAGIFYAVQSLLGLLPSKTVKQVLSLDAIDISDHPRFTWRGMHYDIARNFHGKQAILTLLEQMGRFKLNKLHLHLTDDEGWRLEIPGLPELTDIGAQRCFDLQEQDCLLTQLGNGPGKLQSGSGFLTTDDYIELVRFAKQRNIEVIPEIDMPGHARAAIVAMKARYQRLLSQGDESAANQYLLADLQDKSEYLSVQSYSDNAINPCLPSTFHFVQKVMYELERMHRMAGSKLNIFHMGGDEVGKGAWQKSPACQQQFDSLSSPLMGVDDIKPYFVKKVAELAAQRGLAIAGWEDGLMYNRDQPFQRNAIPNQQVIANAWDNIWEAGVSDRAYLLANAGYDVVLSSATHLYFDHPNEASPFERGYHWATRYSDLYKVFSYTPDDLYANAARTLPGDKITDLDHLVNKHHVALQATGNVLGIQAQLWSETVRSAAQMENMVFPRIIALAERAWHKADWELQPRNKQSSAFANDWHGFLRVLIEHVLPELDRQGIHFYVPPPRVKQQADSLIAEPLIEGLEVLYSCDKGQSWSRGQQAFCDDNSQVLFKTRLGNQHSREISLAELSQY
ncbi:family 20 glycosylhydrolase [Neptunicella sp.]|uniref:family 20 glycosylhydrolase n=1 Tax=Neptunicella sp. TaxID=2125986 RepID=UPI003F68F396